jgi:four helix bundle protein
MRMIKKYDLQNRLIAFAGEVILFIQKQDKNHSGNYLYNQILRSSGSAALNFAESQGCSTDRDYVHKMSITLKELKETEVNFQIMKYVDLGAENRERLINENVELIKIITTIRKNRINKIQSI